MTTDKHNIQLVPRQSSQFDLSAGHSFVLRLLAH